MSLENEDTDSDKNIGGGMPETDSFKEPVFESGNTGENDDSESTVPSDNQDNGLGEASEASENVKKKLSAKRIVVEICMYAAMLFICVCIIPKYVIQRTVVSGSSMLNTLHNNESILVEKVSYRFTDPDRFDIIVFYPYGRDDPDDYYVKRIIGLPGETIQIIGDDIYIDGEVLEENYGKDPITDEGIASEAITLADDEFFVLGDNREISEDSRIFGPVKKVNIAGHAVFRIFPFNKFGPLTNK